MYVKVTKNSTGQAYYHLVESYWEKEKGRSRQRVLMSLGKVGEDRIEETITALSAHKDVFTLIELARFISIDDDVIAPRPLTVVEAMRELSEVRAIPVKIRSNTIWVRTEIKGNAAKLFHAIGTQPL